MPDESPVADPCHDHPDEIVGRYRLGPVLRRSPGCCAHRGIDRLLRRTVSVTLVAGDGLDLPEQSWHGRSPEVAELYDGGAWHGRLFLVTQHPETRTLAETTPPAGLSVAAVRDLGLDVAAALAPLHRHGRCHGGLGPGTVAWSSRGAALADVGLLPWLARWSDVRLDPPYPAPEADPSPAGDVYALGRLLDELAPRRVPPAVRTLLAAMTAASPADRPDLDVVADRLRAWPVPSRRRAGAGGARGRRALVVAAAALLLGSGVGLGVVVNAAGGGSSTAYASAVEPTLVPGVPRPPAVAAAPPLPGPVEDTGPVEEVEPVRPVEPVEPVDDVVEAPRPTRAPVEAADRRATGGSTRAVTRAEASDDEERSFSERSDRSEKRERSERDDSGRDRTSDDPRSDDAPRDRDRSDDRDDREHGDRDGRSDRDDQDDDGDGGGGGDHRDREDRDSSA